jgi:small subunit ribosomal protein S17
MSEETSNVESSTTADQDVAASESDLASSEAAARAVAPPELQGTGVQKRHLRKSRVGEVVSNKMDKTVVVAVVRRVVHPKFGKIIKRTKKLYAHDAENKCAIGDLVRIEETRPLSRLKRWQLVEILKH